MAETRAEPGEFDPHYLPQLLLLLQSRHLRWIGDLDFVVFAGADSGLCSLHRALQIGLPYTIHVPKHRRALRVGGQAVTQPTI